MRIEVFPFQVQMRPNQWDDGNGCRGKVGYQDGAGVFVLKGGRRNVQRVEWAEMRPLRKRKDFMSKCDYVFQKLTFHWEDKVF